MGVLIGEELTKALHDGSISVEPLDPAQVGPGSIDLTLGNDFRVFEKQAPLCHVDNDSEFHDMTRAVHVEDSGFIVMEPGEMVLGITRERITLADNISGRLEGRSRFARFGLAIHVTAGFIQPGIANQQVLEIVNLGHGPLALHPGTRICQFIFETCAGHARYGGRFADQTAP